MTAKTLALFAAAAASLPAAGPVTFSETIAPIMYQNCVTCHRPNQAAPFALISYEDVKKRGSVIAAVTKSRYMPPWHAAHGYGEFAEERRLSEAQIAAIGEWVSHGMPQGDPSKMPQLPQFPDGWHLGKPDLVLEMPVGFNLPASGPDIYRNFVIPTHLSEDKSVRAVEFHPSARKVVHHVLYAYTEGGALAKVDGADGRPGFGGMGSIGVTPGGGNSGGLGGWAVGATPIFLPAGLALPLPKGADFILQMHFHLTGKPETERSEVGIYFADQAPERKLMALQLPALFGFGAGIDIPAGNNNYTVDDSFTLPVDVTAYSAGAHAHYVGKEMKATATLPDGATKPLLWIQDWDFAWQDRYNYKTPITLPKGTRVDVHLRYDNSAGNPRNPSNPPKRVQWGEQSFDEMGSVTMQVVAVHKEDEAVLQQALADRARAALRKGVQDGTAARFQQERAATQAAVRQLTEFSAAAAALLHRQPRDEQAVGLHVFPIRNEAAGNLAAVPRQQPFQFLAGEPALPFRRLEAPPLLGIFIDHGDAAPGLHHPAQFRDGAIDLDGVLEGFCRVSAIEEIILKRKLGQGTRAPVNSFRDKPKHLFGDVQPPKFRLRLPLMEYSGKASFATAGVKHPFPTKLSQMLTDELHVMDTGIDRGGKMLLVTRRLVERRLNLSAQLRSQPPLGFPRKQTLPLHR